MVSNKQRIVHKFLPFLILHAIFSQYDFNEPNNLTNSRREIYGARSHRPKLYRYTSYSTSTDARKLGPEKVDVSVTSEEFSKKVRGGRPRRVR